MYFSRVLEAEKSPAGMRSGEDVILTGAIRFLHSTTRRGDKEVCSSYKPVL